MTEVEIIKGHCPNCASERKAFVRGKHRISWADDTYPIDGSTTCYILECCGCETVFFLEEVYFSEDVSYYEDPMSGETRLDPNLRVSYFPSENKRTRPAWLIEIENSDGVLGSLLTELYKSFDQELSVLSAIGIRTCFDRATELLGIKTTSTFAQKLSDLQADGRIGETERDILSVLVDAGGAAAHRAWKPSTQDLGVMADLLENFLHRSFILRKSSDDLRKNVPQRRSSK